MNNRFVSLTIVFFLVNIQLTKAGYFTPSYSGNPFCPMSFLVTAASVDGNLLDAGDEIGVFDGELCVGNYIVDGHESFGMSVSMNDPSSNTIGFKSGHAISYKIWLKETKLVVNNIQVTYTAGFDTLFRPFGTAIVQLSGKKDSPESEVIAGKAETSDIYNITATAYVGRPYTNKIALAGLTMDAVSVDQVEFPVWLTYKKDREGYLILEGVPQKGDLGKYNAVINISDGHHSIYTTIDLEVIEDGFLSLVVQNNPSYGNYTVVIDHPEIENTLDVRVYNLCGEVIYSETYRDNSTRFSLPIDLTGKASNTYLLEVKTDKSREIEKLILL